jgi:hypothetical protein
MPKVVHMADVFIQENSRHLADVSIYSTDWFSVESFRNHSTRTTVAQIMVRQLKTFVADHTNETTVEDGRRKSFCCHHFHKRDNTQH